MKSKTSYSAFAMMLTLTLLVGLLVFCIAIGILIDEYRFLFFILLSLYAILIAYGLYFGVSYIEADSDYIYLGSPLSTKRIPMCLVEKVELFQPTMGAIRVYASNGFMGYWGIFREGDIGKYYGFYGKASDCFLVTMKNRRQYLLGCSNPEKMVDYIKSQICK